MIQSLIRLFAHWHLPAQCTKESYFLKLGWVGAGCLATRVKGCWELRWRVHQSCTCTRKWDSDKLTRSLISTYHYNYYILRGLRGHQSTAAAACVSALEATCIFEVMLMAWMGCWMFIPANRISRLIARLRPVTSLCINPIHSVQISRMYNACL